MTDPSSTPSNPEPNSTPPAATPPAASAPPAYTPGTPGGAPAKKGLSLAGFIIGIASVVFFWSSWFAIIIGVVGLVLSLIARSKEPAAPNWMKILGLVFSIVGIVLGAIVLIIGIAILANAGSYTTP